MDVSVLHIAAVYSGCSRRVQVNAVAASSMEAQAGLHCDAWWDKLPRPVGMLHRCGAAGAWLDVAKSAAQPECCLTHVSVAAALEPCA